MEKRHSGSSGFDSCRSGNTRNINMCDHEDQFGVWCSRPAEYVLEIRDVEYPMFLCKQCLFLYNEDDSKVRVLK